MTKLESYMVGGEFTATQFLAEVEAHPDDPPLKLALEELSFFRPRSRSSGSTSPTVSVADDPRTDDLGYARVDVDRAQRTGDPEVVYGAGKTPQQVVGILDRLHARHPERAVLATRLSEEAQEAVRLRAARRGGRRGREGRGAGPDAGVPRPGDGGGRWYLRRTGHQPSKKAVEYLTEDNNNNFMNNYQR